MSKISAVIITYNEEQNIGDCIDSLTSVADEIVVVDSFSTDKTETICKSKGVKFLQHKFEGYIEQKNYAVMQASFDYVLSLDADERLSETLQQSILKEKNNLTADAYTMNRLNNFCGQFIKHCGWYPDRKLRLWDRRKGQWGGENPHDKVEMKGGPTTSFLKGDLLHYTVQTVEQYERQLEKFSDIAAKARFQKGKSSTRLWGYISAAFTFVRTYIFKLGFLDGYYGLVVCKLSAWYNYLKYSKLAALSRNGK